MIPAMLCDFRYLVISSAVFPWNIKKNRVITSRFNSMAFLSAPEIYCMSISSLAFVLRLLLIRSATLPACLEESAAATEFGTKFSSSTDLVTLSLVSSLTFG